MSQEKHELIYITDPMCSWCYGFSPELTEVVSQMDSSIQFEMVMGGLRPYNTETMTQLGDFLKEHWEEVAKRSGVEFKYDILEDQFFVYDTEPASRAVVVMRNLKPEKTFDFLKAVQRAFYQDNKNTNLTETYLSIVQSYGIDPAVFSAAFESEEYKNRVRADFSFAGQLGVRGFPTLILKSGSQYFLISNGYATAEQILSQIQKTMLEVEHP